MKRTGLRRVACADCDLAVYSTVAALERGPLPCCPDHGALLPDDLELAFAVLEASDLARHPGVAEYERECASVARGQAGPGLSLRRLGKPPLNDPSVLADQRVRDSLTAAARARQRMGLVQFKAAAQEAAEIPF